MKSPIFNKFVVNQAINKLGYAGLIKAYQEMSYAYDVENGKKFATTEDEINDIIKEVPRLEKVRKELTEITKKIRVSKGLPE